MIQVGLKIYNTEVPETEQFEMLGLSCTWLSNEVSDPQKPIVIMPRG